MNGARFVHDTLEAQGWDVLVADAQRVKGLAPLACKTDKIDARVLTELSFRDLVPAIWLPDPQVRRERELARFRLHLVRHRSKAPCYSGGDRRVFAERVFAVTQLLDDLVGDVGLGALTCFVTVRGVAARPIPE